MQEVVLAVGNKNSKYSFQWVCLSDRCAFHHSQSYSFVYLFAHLHICNNLLGSLFVMPAWGWGWIRYLKFDFTSIYIYCHFQSLQESWTFATVTGSSGKALLDSREGSDTHLFDFFKFFCVRMRLNCVFLLLFTPFYPLHFAFPCPFFLSAVTCHQETTPGSAGYAKARHHPTSGWCPVLSHRYRALEAWLRPDDLHAQLWRLQKTWFVPCQFSWHQWTVTLGGFTSETQEHSRIL